MTDKRIEEIYRLVEKALEKGQRIVRVHIFPFRMSRWELDSHLENRWYEFWENLKEGYDYFEQHHIPPDITVCNGRYCISGNGETPQEHGSHPCPQGI
jgi:murein L,D-transpeptidase YafK